MNNVISYVAPKKETMAHSMTLDNRILCIVGISIFGFKTYWEQVFNFMDIKTMPTLTDFLQAETFNAEKENSYYQRYDIKRLIAFHKQAMIKQKLYDNMLARRSGMDYSAGILFQTSIINMEQAQELTMNNQPEKCNKSGAVMAPSSTPELEQRIALWGLQCERQKKWPGGWRYLNPKQRRH